jgi:putative nucleotidyltransferase with HDIG domain
MTMIRLEQFTARQVRALRAVRAAARGAAAPMLVGGALRDIVLGRATAGEIDLDIAVPAGALGLGGRLAERLGGAFVALDTERGAARVVTDEARLDVTDYRAPTLDDDLAARDFTVNALAASIPDLLARGRTRIIDPAGGLDDLRARRLSVPHERVLADDPLRALRGVRLEAQLGLRLAPRTARAIRSVAPAVARVSPERVRDELSALLRVPETAKALRRLDALRILTVVLPEIEAMRATTQPAPHRFTVLEHSLRAVAGADRLVAQTGRLVPFGDDLTAHLEESIGGGLRRRDVLKLGALLHDVSKPETRRTIAGRVRFFEHDTIGAARARTIAERLKLPSRAADILERLVRHHLRPMHLAQAGPLTRRARYRFFRDLREDTRDLLLLTIADAAAVTGASPFAVWRHAALVHELMRGWQEEQTVIAAPPLVRGDDVMARFGLAPGPEVGRLLHRAREAQDLGLVRDREEALAYLDASRGAPLQ